MAGVKGRSGRKSFYDEKAIANVINLSLRTITDFLNSPNVSLKDKANVAQHFVTKSIPQKVQGEGFGDKIINIVNQSKEVSSGRIPERISV